MKDVLKRSAAVLVLALMATAICFASGQSETKKESADLTFWSVCNYVGYDEFWEEVAKR